MQLENERAAASHEEFTNQVIPARFGTFGFKDST
jgi:hypothetical protein